MIINTKNLAQAGTAVPEWDNLSKKRACTILIGLFQTDNPHQNETHVQELIKIGRLSEEIYFRQPGAYQGEPHPGSKRRSSRDLLHGHREKDDITYPKDDVAGKRQQDLPMLATGKEGAPANGP